jgi:hypothetical protein
LRGLGRALLETALDRIAEPVSLTATEAGLPLYRSLGFEALATSVWWTAGA